MTATSNPGADPAPAPEDVKHDRHRHPGRDHQPGTDLRAGRRQVARSRGALSGILLLVLGVWTALIPFVGPYFNFAFTPRPDDAWHWTSGRGLYELLPGAVTALAGLVLLVSASRALTVLMAWLAAVSGAWLVVGPSLDRLLNVGTGAPDATGDSKTVALELLYFFAVGVAIALIAGIALGRLSTHSVRDVRAAERRAEAEAAEQRRLEAEQSARAEQQRRAAEVAAAERRDHDSRSAAAAETRTDTPAETGSRPAGDTAAHAQPRTDVPTTEQPRDPAGYSGHHGYGAGPGDAPAQQGPAQQAPPPGYVPANQGNPEPPRR